jgi:sugar transferase (PEP-CTERM/EpsH1 system associated)
MQLLFLTPQLPYPPRQGTTLRNFNLIKQLAQRHTIDLLSFMGPGDELTPDSELHRLCRHVATAPQPQRSSNQRAQDTLLSPQPDMALRLASPEMAGLVRAWTGAQQYDIVQAEGIEMAQYGMLAARTRPASAAPPQFVFDNHNCEYLLQKRNALTDLRQVKRLAAAGYSLIQWQKLARYEAAVCRNAAAVTVVSQADGAALQHIVPEIQPVVVSNGIDLSQYEQPPGAMDPIEEPATLVFTGKMDYRPNIDAVLWFGRDVLPLISDVNPAVRFQIVGMNPHARLDELRTVPQIEITGAVDDVRPYINRATVYVIPMRIGGGTRFKALEAMASRKAIVSTSLGIEGIAVEDGRELLIADDPVSMAAAILQLLDEDAAERAQLGEAGYRFVSANYAWEQIVPRMEAVYDLLMSTK